MSGNIPTDIENYTKDYPLRTSYGTVILPKGTKLYCDKSIYNEKDPVVFAILHPSEWQLNSEAEIITIELQRDVSLLFMISLIRNIFIFTALDFFLKKRPYASAKKDCKKIKKWIPYLQKEQFDGWLTCIANNDGTDFMIINDPSIFKITDCKLINRDWYISRSIDDKSWGINYSISKNYKMILNSQFKQQIEDYINTLEGVNQRGSILYYMFKHANIEYINVPLQKIKWY